MLGIMINFFIWLIKRWWVKERKSLLNVRLFFLKHLKEIIFGLVGIAFSVQKIDKLPMGESDVFVDEVIFP